MNIRQEIVSHWDQIQDENFEFDSSERLIASLEQVTTELVNQKLFEMMGEN